MELLFILLSQLGWPPCILITKKVIFLANVMALSH